MIDLLTAGVAATQAIRWEDLGLRPGIDLGFFTLRFYSLAYLAGILLGYWHLSKMIKAPGSPMAQRHADDLFFYCTLGIILGGRLGYAAFYQPALFTGWTPSETISWDLLRLWDGGMSFHGGVIGTTLAIAFVSWRGRLSFIRVCDYISVNVGFGMLFGRLANFINGELWGRPTDVAWAMIFPADPTGLPRHPSQLYEAALEGALVIAVMLPLFWYTRARWRPALLVGTFAALVSLGRFIAEFFREPDAQLAEFARQTGLNMGQWLSIPLILASLALVVWALRRPEMGSARAPATA
jgi:phosphatidylglycerol:prolipoprotein diacylglycerol transferase